MFSVTLFVWVLGLVHDLDRDKGFNEWAYLTKWGVVLDWITFLCLFIVSLAFCLNLFNARNADGEVSQGFRWFVAGTEGIQFLTVAADICIVIMYWTCLYDGKKQKTLDLFLNIYNHGVGPLLIFVEFLFNRVPVRKRYLIVLAVFTVVYLGINLLASKINEPVYKIMSWDSWKTFWYALGAVALAFFGGAVQFLLRWKKVQSPVHVKNSRRSFCAE